MSHVSECLLSDNLFKKNFWNFKGIRFSTWKFHLDGKPDTVLNTHIKSLVQTSVWVLSLKKKYILSSLLSGFLHFVKHILQDTHLGMPNS